MTDKHPLLKDLEKLIEEARILEENAKLQLSDQYEVIQGTNAYEFSVAVYTTACECLEVLQGIPSDILKGAVNDLLTLSINTVTRRLATRRKCIEDLQKLWEEYNRKLQDLNLKLAKLRS
jgi:hypothetical protein